MKKQFFNFVKYICIDSCCISQLGYTLQILFLLFNNTHFACLFPLTALTESQPEIAWRAGRLSNTPSDHLLVPISRILTFEPTPIWIIKRQFTFLTLKAARMTISLSTENYDIRTAIIFCKLGSKKSLCICFLMIGA